MAWTWRELRWLNIGLGWWPDACKTEKWRRLSDIRGKILFWFLFVMVIPEFVHFYFVLVADVFILYDFITGLVPLLMGIEYFSKMFIFILKRERIKKIIDTLDELDEMAKEVLTPEDYEQICRPHHLLCEGTIAYLIMYSFVLVQWLITPFIFRANGIVAFSMDSSYPWDDKELLGWSLSYLIQFIHVFSVIYSLGLLDVFIFIMFIQTSLVMDYLKGLLKKVSFDPNINDRITTTFCIKYHQRILNLCDEIQFFMGIPLLMQVTLATIVMCLCVFLFSSTGSQDIKVLNMLEVAFAQVTEMFLFNWVCQIIEDKGEEIMRAAYDSDWYNRRMEQTRPLYILVEMSKRKITFGVLVTSNFQTFITVLQTTFSYYNFMTVMAE